MPNSLDRSMALVDEIPQRGSSLADALDDRIGFIRNSIGLFENDSAGNKRSLSASEQRSLDKARKVLRDMEAKHKEYVEDEQRDANAAAVRRKFGGAVVGYDASATYRRGDPSSPSYFADLARTVRHDPAAVERLTRARHEREIDGAGRPELRAMSSNTATAGAEFAPPLWLVDEFIAMARPGRPVANSLSPRPLPTGISSVNIPSITSGTSVAEQASQNTQTSNTDPATGEATDAIHTAAGYVVVSQQQLDQVPIAFDEVVGADLAAAYSADLDGDVISKLVGFTGINAITYTDASPTTAAVNQRVSAAMIAVSRNRHAPASHVAMSPERWGNFTSYTDSTGRPLIVPSAAGASMNGIGSSTAVTAEGVAGTLQGLSVVIDASIPTDLGTGTNQDEILVYRGDDLWLYESDMHVDVMPQTYGQNLSVLIRAYRYWSLIVRYPKAVALITGTGMIPPALGS